MIRAAAWLASVALLAGTAVAQDAASLAIYQRLEKTYPAPAAARLMPELRAATERVAATWGACRPTALAIRAIAPATADQTVIQQITRAGGHNAWSVVARPAGCTDQADIRFLVGEQGDGSLAAAVTGYGDSLVWSSLVRDAQVAAMVTADRLLPKDGACSAKPPRRVDGRIVSRSADLGAPSYGVIFKGSWRELWTFERCGRRAAVAIDFRADGDGGAYFQPVTAAE